MVKKGRSRAKAYMVHHVVPKLSGEWAIKTDGTTKIVKVFSTKRDAIEFTHKISRDRGLKIVIHGRDGKVMSTHNYKEVEQSEPRPESGFGCARGLVVVPPNFEEPLEEFHEYI